MKNLVYLFLVLTYSSLLYAQRPTYDDLLILYADGNYSKLIKESTKYSEKDDSKNDAIVFYWQAKGYYKISFQADRDEEYKNAFKDCFTAIGKCLKKDKDSSIQREYREFFVDVKRTLIEAIRNEVDAQDYRKASSWAMRAYKMNQADIGAKMIEGACKYQVKDKGGARALWKEADKLMATVKDFSTFSKEDKEMLKIGAFETAICYINMRQTDKAKELLNKLKPAFEDDENFQTRYNEMFN